MNWKRITTGGLLAGLVINVLEIALEPLMGSQMEEFFTRLRLPNPGESVMIAFALTSLVLGILTVWLYAAIEPRYGPSKGTAVRAGTVVWALSCLLPNIVLYAMGVLVGPLFWLATICPLVESILASLAGAWVYGRAPTHQPDLAAMRA